MTLRTLAATTCISLMVVSASQAATFDYSYTFADDTVITGAVDGILQADLNTISTAGFEQPLLNGLPFSENYNIFTDAFFTGPAVFNLDGVGLNFAHSRERFSFGVFFFDGGNVGTLSGQAFTPEQFVRERWEVVERGIAAPPVIPVPTVPVPTVPVPAVPLPAGGLLLLSGIGGMAVLRSRKKRAAQTIAFEISK